MYKYEIIKVYDNTLLFGCNSYSELEDKVKEMIRENGDDDWSILGISDIEEYIEYCTELKLVIN